MRLVGSTSRSAEVVLSRRNLLSLLHKLDQPGSVRTLYKHTREGVLVVTAEEDESHYTDKAAGPMTPDTEAFIAGFGQREGA